MHTIFRTALRVLAWLSALVVGLVFVGIIGLYLFFDPNEFKPQITTVLQQKTGLPFVIQGKVKFTLFPWVGIQAEKISLENVLTIQTIDLNLPLRDLLAKRIVIDSLKIQDLTLTLIKQKNGKMNWETLFAPSSSPVSKTTSASSPQGAPKNKLPLKLQRFDITNATITYIDQQKDQTWEFDKLALHGRHFVDQASPLTATFNVSLRNNQKPIISANMTTKGTVGLHSSSPTLHLDSKMILTLPHSPWDGSTIQALIKGDWNKQIVLQSFDWRSNRTHATGKITIPMETDLPVTVSLAVNQLDVNAFQSFLSSNQAPSKNPTVTKVSAPKTLAVSHNVVTDRSRLFQGELTFGTLQYDNYTFQDAHLTFRKKGNNVTINPFTATFYGGKLQADLTKTDSQTTIRGTLNQLPVQSLLKALNKPEKLYGDAHIDFSLWHYAANLHGVITCKVENGTIKGADLPYYLALAQSFLKKQKASSADTKQTSFRSLSATLKLHDNIIDNNDLVLRGDHFIAKGEGSIYLTNQTLSYKLQANQIDDQGKEISGTYPLAIRIKGPLNDPKIEPNYDVYLKKLSDVEVRKQLDKQLQKGLNKILGDKNTSSDETSSTDLDSKIDKAIEKGLKKIFK